ITDDTHLTLTTNYTAGNFTNTPPSRYTPLEWTVVTGITQAKDAAISGTLTATLSSGSVVGVGTLFTSELAVGKWLYIGTDAIAYKVTAITDNTHMTVSPGARVAGSGLSGKITAMIGVTRGQYSTPAMQHFYGSHVRTAYMERSFDLMYNPNFRVAQMDF